MRLATELDATGGRIVPIIRQGLFRTKRGIVAYNLEMERSEQEGFMAGIMREMFMCLTL